MAKRELSSTLKSLKFMQRAAQKQDKTKSEEETTLNNKFASSSTVNRKCIVIMEGNPHPGALKGRMSFQSFNPSIDKLNEEAANDHLVQACAGFNGRDRIESDSPNGLLWKGEENSDISRGSNYSDVDHKRKQPETEAETHSPYRMQTSASEEGDGHSSSKNKKGSYQQTKREKLDWSVLRPPKPQTKRG